MINWINSKKLFTTLFSVATILSSSAGFSQNSNQTINSQISQKKQTNLENKLLVENNSSNSQLNKKTNSNSKKYTQEVPTRILKPMKMYSPVDSARISSWYGKRKDHFHRAIDIAAYYHKKVYASQDGKVEFAGWRNGYGYRVVIDHGKDDYGREIKTTYNHLSPKYTNVKKGEWVQAGEKISRIGKTGHIRGVHLHYEIIVDGKKINPMIYLKEAKRKVKKNTYLVRHRPELNIEEIPTKQIARIKIKPKEYDLDLANISKREIKTINIEKFSRKEKRKLLANIPEKIKANPYNIKENSNHNYNINNNNNMVVDHSHTINSNKFICNNKIKENNINNNINKNNNENNKVFIAELTNKKTQTNKKYELKIPVNNTKTKPKTIYDKKNISETPTKSITKKYTIIIPKKEQEKNIEKINPKEKNITENKTNNNTNYVNNQNKPLQSFEDFKKRYNNKKSLESKLKISSKEIASLNEKEKNKITNFVDSIFDSYDQEKTTAKIEHSIKKENKKNIQLEHIVKNTIDSNYTVAQNTMRLSKGYEKGTYQYKIRLPSLEAYIDTIEIKNLTVEDKISLRDTLNKLKNNKYLANKIQKEEFKYLAEVKDSIEEKLTAIGEPKKTYGIQINVYNNKVNKTKIQATIKKEYGITVPLDEIKEDKVGSQYKYSFVNFSSKNEAIAFIKSKRGSGMYGLIAYENGTRKASWKKV